MNQFLSSTNKNSLKIAIERTHSEETGQVGPAQKFERGSIQKEPVHWNYYLKHRPQTNLVLDTSFYLVDLFAGTTMSYIAKGERISKGDVAMILWWH